MNDKYKLRKLLTIKNGKDYKHLKSGSVPVYGSGGLMLFVDDYLYNDESILLPRKGTLNNISYVNGKFWTVDTMYYTIINKNLVCPKYLYYYLSLLDLSCRDSGSTLPSMTFDSYYDLDIELPELSYQKKVSKILTLIDNKIKVNNQINDNLCYCNLTIHQQWQ